jgi:hypothetical protein
MDVKWWDELPQVESIFMDDCDRPNNLEISKKNKLVVKGMNVIQLNKHQMPFK